MDLVQLIERDPDQEVTGQALPLIDAVISEARQALPDKSTLRRQIVDVISTEAIEAGEPLRAADALLIVGQLVAVLGSPVDEGLLAADRALFAEFRQLLPSGRDPVTLLRDYDFGAAFRWDSLDPLSEFVRAWDDAEHQFHDSGVETERQHLLDLASAFVNRLAMDAGPDEGGWYSIVPVEHRDTFRLGDRENDVRRVDEVNQMATEVYNQHQHFVEVARRRLAI
jgi:hypothetical protein